MEAGLAVSKARETSVPRAYAQERRWRACAGAFWAIAAANVVVIVWLWVRGGNIATVHSFGDLSTGIGRLTGLVSAYLALIQLLLLSRLPWIERAVGFDRLTVWHRLNGKVCLYLVLAHVVFITIGYAAMDRISIPREVVALLNNYTGMIAATVGTVLMIAVVGTSLVIVRRRLSYESWYLVHLLAYAGIALAWFHQIPTGNELTADPTAAAYWTSLYVITAALLILYRLVLPLINTYRYSLRVAAVTAEGPGIVSLHLTGRHLDRLTARAGQFFLWRFLDRTRWWEAHPFSLSAVPDGQALRITVKGSGNFTRRLQEIAPGTRVIAEGPFGVFTAAACRSDKVLLIAGGIGITPIRAICEEIAGNVVLVYRVVSEHDIVFRAELDRLAHERGVTVHYVIGDHTDPAATHLLSTDHLRTLIPDLVEREVYLCGPTVMMETVERNLRAAGLPGTHIHSERFAL